MLSVQKTIEIKTLSTGFILSEKKKSFRNRTTKGGPQTNEHPLTIKTGEGQTRMRSMLQQSGKSED